VPETVEARVAIVVEDDVSTGDMAPDGAIGMSLWSNVAECATHMFRRQDPDFPARALEYGSGLIVGGHNYGQGSSREIAAIAPLHLGIRAVVAKSFARIHRRNLICQGILPLDFEDESDYERAAVGDEWRLPGARATVAEGGERILAETPGGEVALVARLSDGERAMLLAGGLLAYVREGGLDA
jgi:aconitate hydratase